MGLRLSGRAGKFLDEWCRQTMRSRIEPMKKIATSLRKHRELILNYFRAQKLFSSGVVEGLNNKAKVTMRKSYDLHLPSPRTRPLSLTSLLPFERLVTTIFSDESFLWERQWTVPWELVKSYILRWAEASPRRLF